jgi:DNA-binding SARP family transcriptional activator
MTLLPAAEFHIRLLGGFELSVAGCGCPLNSGSQRLVTFLALHNRALPRGYVAGVLWPDVPADRANANLRAGIWRVPPQCRPLIDLNARHISLAAGVAVDYLDAKALAHRLLDRQQANAADLSRHARSELSCELLPACYDEWVLIERERFRQLRVHALEAQCERLTARSRYGEAIDAGLAAVCAEPLRESSHRALINAHLAEGNTAEARRQYELYRRVLHDELDTEPSTALHDLTIPPSPTGHSRTARPPHEPRRAGLTGQPSRHPDRPRTLAR